MCYTSAKILAIKATFNNNLPSQTGDVIDNPRNPENPDSNNWLLRTQYANPIYREIVIRGLTHINTRKRDICFLESTSRNDRDKNASRRAFRTSWHSAISSLSG
jgi:hypothetical protein